MHVAAPLIISSDKWVGKEGQPVWKCHLCIFKYFSILTEPIWCVDLPFYILWAHRWINVTYLLLYIAKFSGWNYSFVWREKYISLIYAKTLVLALVCFSLFIKDFIIQMVCVRFLVQFDWLRQVGIKPK